MTRVDRWLGAALLAGAIGAMVVHASPAAAHTGGPTGGLWNGVTHPFLGVDHIFAMVTVGTLAVVLSRSLLVPAAFLLAMTVGGALAIIGMRLPAGELAIALSVVALGGALVAGRAVQPGLALGLVAVAGFVHGHAHGAEAPSASHPAVYVLGFVVATAALHVAGVGMGLGIQQRPRTWATIGAVVAGAGVGLVAGIL